MILLLKLIVTDIRLVTNENLFSTKTKALDYKVESMTHIGEHEVSEAELRRRAALWVCVITRGCGGSSLVYVRHTQNRQKSRSQRTNRGLRFLHVTLSALLCFGQFRNEAELFDLTFLCVTVHTTWPQSGSSMSSLMLSILSSSAANWQLPAHVLNCPPLPAPATRLSAGNTQRVLWHVEHDF